MFGICQSLMKLSSTHFDIRHMTRSNYCISWWLHFLLFHLCAISCVDVHGEKKFKIKWKIFVHWVMLAFRNQPLTEKKKLTNEVAAMKRINEWKKSKYTQTHTHAYINKRNAMNKFISATNNNKSKMKRSNFMSYLLLLATNYQFIVELKRTDRMEKEKKERTGSCCMESDFFLLHSIWCVLCIDLTVRCCLSVFIIIIVAVVVVVVVRLEKKRAFSAFQKNNNSFRTPTIQSMKTVPQIHYIRFELEM